MAEIKLYSAKTCPYAQRTRLGLIEKGLDYSLTEIDLKNTPEWFYEVSPYGKVPVLEHGGDQVWESAIINEYLEECYPEPPLLPSAPGRRAYARFWIDFANVKLVPTFYKLLLEQDPARRRELADRYTEHLRFMEREALVGPYWLGQELSLADLAFYPWFERFCVLEHYRDVSLPEDCARLWDWWATMHERDSVQKLKRSPEFYVASYSHYADGSASGSTAQDMRSH